MNKNNKKHIILLTAVAIIVILVFWLGNEYSSEARAFLRELRRIL